MTMKANWVLTLLMASFCLLMGNSGANPVDLSAPSGELGAANPKGYLEIWREIDGVGLQLGKGSYLPFRYKFSTDPTIGGILGPGFYVPMFEAKNVLIREQVMRAYLPCGKGLYFWRDSVDPNSFQSVDKQWFGYATPDDFIVWRDDGWKILYHKGRLTSITSDDNHTFTWAYETGGGGSISLNGQSIFTLEPNSAGQPAAFVFGGKRYTVDYAERPITQMLLGQVAIKELNQALSSFKYPDGTMDTFKFVLTPDRVPTLSFTDKDKQQTLYSWDAATSYITTEKGPKGDWTYKIGQVAQDFGVPPISRTSSDGKTESIDVDNKTGTYRSVAADGITTVTQVFETPGPLYHKVQKIEEINKNTTTILFRASYDEVGRLSRVIDKHGYITTYTYGEGNEITSRQLSLPVDPNLLAQIKDKGEQLTNALAKAKNESDHQDALSDLVEFYMFDMLDSAKAASLASQLDHRHSFVIKLQEMDMNSTLTSAEKLKAYEDLLASYPEYKQKLNFLIRITKGN